MSPNAKSVSFVLICLCSFAISNHINTPPIVHLSQEWKPGVGWVVNCSWELVADDLFLSTGLHRNNELISYFYKPTPVQSHRTISSPDDDMEITCERTATCTMVIKPKHPPTADFNVMCDVMRDYPETRMVIKRLSILPLVPPSDAVIEVLSKATYHLNPLLNCSASGIPAPEIEWTFGDDSIKIDSYNSSSVWNTSSMVFDAWSTTIPTLDLLPVRCTAKVLQGGKYYTSKTVSYTEGKNGFIISHDVTIFKKA